jgi:imidazolonepropionase-like amidohydrolase
MEILLMLTIAPATRLGAAKDKGTLDPGKLADFVILSTDPATDSQALTKVQTTVRTGIIIWQSTN